MLELPCICRRNSPRLMIRPDGRNCCRQWPMGRRPAWGHLNLLREYDFSEDKLQDAVGIKPPKLTD
jgi:hypothetical protein